MDIWWLAKDKNTKCQWLPSLDISSLDKQWWLHCDGIVCVLIQSSNAMGKCSTKAANKTSLRNNKTNDGSFRSCSVTLFSCANLRHSFFADVFVQNLFSCQAVSISHQHVVMFVFVSLTASSSYLCWVKREFFWSHHFVVLLKFFCFLRWFTISRRSMEE